MFCPPISLVAGVMKRPVMGEAKRHRPFIAHLYAHGARLRETNVMGLAWRSTTDQARLGGDEYEMWFVAKAPLRADGNHRIAGNFRIG